MYASVKTFRGDLAVCCRDGGRIGRPVAPFDHAAVPAGELAPQMPSEMRVGCVGWEVQRAILTRFVRADDQCSTPENGSLLTRCDGADRLAIHAPHDALCVPVDGVLKALLESARWKAHDLAADALERCRP